MKYVEFSKIVQDTKDFPDGEVFTVYQKDFDKYFKVTQEKPDLWAFAIKIKGKFTLSTFKRANAPEKEVKESLKQVLFAGVNGWSNTKEKKVNEYLETVDQYECLYCGAQTLEVTGPCDCRQFKKSESGIISPLENW